MIDANEAAIEEAGVDLHSYTAPGHGHRILEWPRFYELEVNGEKLVDWVDSLIEGEPGRGRARQGLRGRLNPGLLA